MLGGTFSWIPKWNLMQETADKHNKSAHGEGLRAARNTTLMSIAVLPTTGMMCGASIQRWKQLKALNEAREWRGD